MDAPASPPRATAVVPVKALARAKGRLESHLDVADRRDLTAFMLRRVVDACRASRGVDGVLVVAGDREAAALAGSLGVEALLEARPGLASALLAADRALEAEATLVVTADLPLATAEAIDTVCEAGAPHPAVVVAESVDGGTSALLRRPARVIGTAFGPGSAAAHLALAAGAGLDPVRLRVPELALDIDDVGHLAAAAARSPELAGWLRDRGLGPRAAAS